MSNRAIAIVVFGFVCFILALSMGNQSPRELQPWQKDILRDINPRECSVEDLQYRRCYHN